MKYLKTKYLAMNWLYQIGFGAVVTGLIALVAWQSGYNPAVTAAYTAGLLVVIHIGMKAFRFLPTAFIVLVHAVSLSILSLFYGSMITQDFGYGSIILAFSVLSVTTVLYSWLAVKLSVGRLWLTLMLVYLTLDLVGVILMDLTGVANMLVPVAVSGVVLFLRCVLWRNLFSSIKNKDAQESHNGYLKDLQSEDVAEAVKETLEASETLTGAVSTVSDKGAPINLVYRTATDSYYLTIIKTKKSLIISDKGISTNGLGLEPLLVDSANTAAKLHRRSGKGTNAHTVLVNATDQGSEGATVNIQPKGVKRAKTNEIRIVSLLSLLHILNQGT